LLGLAMLASRILLDQVADGARDVVRKTTFVAYGEATIDELYYLATEHANREAGAGHEAFDVKVGSMGTPLVGDDTRQSWPSTSGVREPGRGQKLWHCPGGPGGGGPGVVACGQKTRTQSMSISAG